MQYIVTLPDTQQGYALLDYLKSSGVAVKVEALKNKTLNGTQTDAYEVPARTDKELIEMINNQVKYSKEYLHDDSDIF